MSKKKTVLEKLGFPKRVKRLTKKIVRERMKILREMIDSGKLDRNPEKLHLARYYLSKYKWMLNSGRVISGRG